MQNSYFFQHLLRFDRRHKREALQLCSAKGAPVNSAVEMDTALYMNMGQAVEKKKLISLTEFLGGIKLNEAMIYPCILCGAVDSEQRFVAFRLFDIQCLFLQRIGNASGFR